jgi:ligand-binding sensor domain-containing protein
MKIRLPLSVFFFITLVCSRFLCPAQDIHFNLVKPPDDNFAIVYAMAQDAQGYLWFATGNGLYKYDGYQYISYHNDPRNLNSPAAVKIDYMAFDKAGCLWLSPYNLGLDRFDPASGTFIHFRHHNNELGSLACDSVKAIMQDHEGTLWLGTMNGLDKFDSKTNTFIHYKNDPNDPSSLSCNDVFALYEDKQGAIWVGTGNPFDLQKTKEGGLNKLNKKTGKFTRYMHDDKDVHSLIDNRVRAIFEDSRGTFWIGTAGDGLHTMNRTNGTFERHLYDPLHPDKLSRPPIKDTRPGIADHITFITEDNKGKIWIGAFQGGLNIYDPATQKVSYYGADAKSTKKMADNFFWTAYKTKDNIMWVSTWENNLYKVKPFENTIPHTRIGKQVICFAEDDAHTLWVTTQNGLIHINSDGKQEQFLINKDSSSQQNQMFFIEKDANKFWLTTATGLYLFDPVTKTFSSFHHQAGNLNSLISDTVFTLKKDIDNTLWIGTANGLDKMDTKTRTFRHFQNSSNDTQSISSSQAFTINTDKNQNTWICTLGGLDRLDKKTGHFKRYLTQYNVVSVFEDSEGNLWAAADAGLLKYDKEADNFSKFIDESSVISATSTIWTTEDHDQNLWLSTSKGIVRLNKQNNSATLYGKNQGVNPGALTGFAFTRQNGEILFPDTLGYYEFQPGSIQQNVSAPIVNIDKFLLNDIPVQPSATGILSVPLMQTKEIRLNHNQNTFSFEFSNIDFNSEHEDTRLLFMLQNYDKAWRKAGEEKTAYYFNLPPGKYIFKVKA